MRFNDLGGYSLSETHLYGLLQGPHNSIYDDRRGPILQTQWYDMFTWAVLIVMSSHEQLG